MRFLGLGVCDPVPDAGTIWLYREQLTRAGAIEHLFARFDAALRDAGYLAMVGQIVDATVVEARRPRVRAVACAGWCRSSSGRSRARLWRIAAASPLLRLTRPRAVARKLFSSASSGSDHDAYLRDVPDVRARIADHPINRIDELLPWTWATSQRTATAT